MNIEDIEILLDLIKIKNFSDVAVIHDLSQSTISKKIKKIEEELGIKILNRNSKGVLSVTKAGTRIIPYLENILKNEKRIKKFVDSSNSIYIGISNGVNEDLIFNLTVKLREEKLNPNIIIDSSKNIINKLNKNEYDIGIVGYFNNYKNIYCKSFYKEKIGLAGTSYIENFTLDNIYDIPLILHQNGSGLREYILNYLENNNIDISKLNILYEVGFENFTLKAVINGLGYGFINTAKIKPPLINLLNQNNIERTFWIIGKNEKLINKIIHWREVGLL